MNGKRVAVLYDVEGPLSEKYAKAWFTGSVCESFSRAICKKVGREEYMRQLRIVFDGSNESQSGEIVDFDDNVRLLKLD